MAGIQGALFKFKMFIHGLKNGSVLFVVAGLIGVAVGYFLGLEIAVTAFYVIVVIGGIYFGYTYFPKFGPLIISSDDSAAKNLFYYSMAFGFIFGLPAAIINVVFVTELNLLIEILLVCLAVPMAGMNFIGCFGLGRFMNKSLD